MGSARSSPSGTAPRGRISSARDALANNPDAVELSYYEHGNRLWYVRGRGGHFILPYREWHGVDRAGVWIPDDSVLENTKAPDLADGFPERLRWMVEQAEHACELYTAFLNGAVFGYEISSFKVRRDSAGEICMDPEEYDDKHLFEDSCFGFFDRDGLEDAIEDAVRFAV